MFAGAMSPDVASKERSAKHTVISNGQASSGGNLAS